MSEDEIEILRELYGCAAEIIVRFNRLANLSHHGDFGDTIAIYRNAVEIEEKLAKLVYHHDYKKESAK